MPVFLVAAEGGGVRAAYWTAVVLGRLQDQHPTFARQVFGISGVSGGSVGAAVFAALLRDRAPDSRCREFARRQGHADDSTQLGAFETCAQEVLRQDLLSPGLGRLLAADFLQWFVPAPVPSFDRARTIEDSWSAAYEAATGRNTLDQPFLSISGGGPTPDAADHLSHPALLLNGTHAATSRTPAP